MLGPGISSPWRGVLIEDEPGQAFRGDEGVRDANPLLDLLPARSTEPPAERHGDPAVAAQPVHGGGDVRMMATTAAASSLESLTLMRVPSWLAKMKFFPPTRNVGSPPQASMSTRLASGRPATIRSRCSRLDAGILRTGHRHGRRVTRWTCSLGCVCRAGGILEYPSKCLHGS